MKKIAIHQSNYIPWKGYFDLINMVDEFVIFDDAQYTKNDWRNRNIIKTSQGLHWITIAIKKEKLNKKINQTIIHDSNWAVSHWKQIKQNYSKAKFFGLYHDLFEELFLNSEEMYLSEINLKFIKVVNKILGINTIIRSSREFELLEGRTERLIHICKQCNADAYVSGPSAKHYFNESLAKKENIEVFWLDYNGYKPYEQLYPPFEHGVTILDLIFNTNSNKFMKTFN